jgi:hypothetical protein
MQEQHMQVRPWVRSAAPVLVSPRARARPPSGPRQDGPLAPSRGICSPATRGGRKRITEETARTYYVTPATVCST